MVQEWIKDTEICMSKLAVSVVELKNVLLHFRLVDLRVLG